MVMSAALAAMANPKIDPQLRLGALSMLQARMKSVDATTPQRLFLAQPDSHSAVASTVGTDLLRLEQFERALGQFIVDTRPGKAMRSKRLTSPVASSTLESLGLLVALLVTRLGHGSVPVIGRVVETLAMGKKPVVAGQWVWLDVEMRATGSPQLRRIHLDPTCFAAFQIVGNDIHQIPPAQEGQRAGRRSAHYQRVARDAYSRLMTKMAATGHAPSITKLSDLCHCVIQRLRMVTIPVLATYAQGDIASSSLEPQTWCRMVGYQPPSVVHSDDDVERDQEPAGADALVGIDPGGESDVEERYNAGDLDEDGLVAELRQIMDGERSSWAAGFKNLIAELREEGPTKQTAYLACCWLDHLANERTSKGKYLADGSVRHYRGLLVNRLLHVLPDQLDGLTSDELEDSYNEVIQSRRSLPQTGKIRAALGSFDRYVREQHLPELPPVSLPGFAGLSYAISSRILNEPEFRSGLKLIRDGSLAISGRREDELASFWVLAYRFGLRRTEILGLQVRDVCGSVLRVRINPARHLKTTNAYRVLPLSTLIDDERVGISALCLNRGQEDYLFFDTPPSAKQLEAHGVVGIAKSVLFRATGDERLHPHNMRHSAATLLLLGMLGADLNVRRHPYALGWMTSALDQTKKVDDQISGHLHRKAGRGNALAMMLGHGAELTTYEHYVHCFDLLLYLACWSGRFRRSKRQSYRYLYPARDETSILLAMLGLAPTTLIETQNLTELIARVCKVVPGNSQRLDPVSSVAPMVSSSGGGAFARDLTLLALMNAPGATDLDGYPEQQAERDTVQTILKFINIGIRVDPERAKALLCQWVGARSQMSDWASMKPGPATAWIAEALQVFPSLPIEIQHVYKAPTGNRVKGGIIRVDDAAQVDKRNGSYLIRLADSRRKVSKRGSRSGQLRSRSQPAITWLLVSIVKISEAERVADVDVLHNTINGHLQPL